MRRYLDAYEKIHRSLMDVMINHEVGEWWPLFDETTTYSDAHWPRRKINYHTSVMIQTERRLMTNPPRVASVHDVYNVHAVTEALTGSYTHLPENAILKAIHERSVRLMKAIKPVQVVGPDHEATIRVKLPRKCTRRASGLSSITEEGSSARLKHPERWGKLAHGHGGVAAGVHSAARILWRRRALTSAGSWTRMS